MEKRIISFIEALRQTETMYNRLLELIEDENKAAMVSNVDRLNTIGIEKQNLISQLGRLDQQATRELLNLADALHISSEDLTVSCLAQKVDSPFREQLLHLQQRLRAVVAQVQHANAQYRMLIDHCLRLVHNSLGFFQNWMDTSNVYGAAGDLRNRRPDSGRLLSGCA